MESHESVQFHSAINWMLYYLEKGLKEGGSVNSVTRKVIAGLLLYRSPLLRVMEAVRDIGGFSPVQQGFVVISSRM